MCCGLMLSTVSLSLSKASLNISLACGLAEELIMCHRHRDDYRYDTASLHRTAQVKGDSAANESSNMIMVEC